MVGFKYKALWKSSRTGGIGRPSNLLERLEPECPECGGRNDSIRTISPEALDRRFRVVEGWHA